jgi:hypothetical protein
VKLSLVIGAVTLIVCGSLFYADRLVNWLIKSNYDDK